MSIPFQLDVGIFLETRRILLPWYASVETLQTIGEPDSTQDRKTTYLSWKNDAILGGLIADVHFGGGYKDRFDIGTKAREAANARAGYTELLADLTARLGPPHQILIEKDVMNITYPRSRWSFGSVEVSLAVGERFMEYVSFVIYRDS